MWYHDDTTGRCASVHHRYAAFFAGLEYLQKFFLPTLYAMHLYYDDLAVSRGLAEPCGGREDSAQPERRRVRCERKGQVQDDGTVARQIEAPANLLGVDAAHRVQLRHPDRHRLAADLAYRTRVPEAVLETVYPARAVDAHRVGVEEALGRRLEQDVG
jgi:hypothetical protein